MDLDCDAIVDEAGREEELVTHLTIDANQTDTFPHITAKSIKYIEDEQLIPSMGIFRLEYAPHDPEIPSKHLKKLDKKGYQLSVRIDDPIRDTPEIVWLYNATPFFISVCDEAGWEAEIVEPKHHVKIKQYNRGTNTYMICCDCSKCF